ncbi:MAG: MG2 domain-containing protein, partial [Acetobacteraceae bacterium]
MRRLALLLLTFCLLFAGPLRAAEFNLPGLEREAQAYENRLARKFPAGASRQARQQSERAAEAAYRKQDWPAVAAALETRIGQGEATDEHWFALAQAQMRRKPPEARRALEAAWMAFTASDVGPDQVPALLLMADALKLLDRPVQVIQALEAASERQPNDQAIKSALATARRAAGVLVARVRTESEADPPRACLEFTVAPVRRDDFRAQDWVKLAPAVPDAAITREGDQICISGLPSGATTRLTVISGMPGEGGLSVVRDLSFNVAIANRRPRIDFDTRLFVLPRGQIPALTMSTVNLSAVDLKLARLTERNIVAFVRDNRLGEAIDTWSADDIGERTGNFVWEGKAAVPKWEMNKTVRTALPVPDALATAGPGLYALIARVGDGTPGNASAVQMILRTDLAPTVWRGSDGLTIQVRGYADAKPRPDAVLRLLAENNDILAETRTDAMGVGRFAAPLTRGEGPMAPRAIQVFAGDNDFATLDLTSAAFDLSDRGVAGLPQPGPLDAYVWLDRGIYRPGETVQVMSLLRDDGGRPADVPTRVIVRRPDGQVFYEGTPQRQPDASVYIPVTLSRGASLGTWSVEVKADPSRPPIGKTEFRVDAFVPDTMAVDLGPASGPIVAGKPYALPVAARFLYGAPGAGLTGSAAMRLVIDPTPFPTLAGYRIGMESELFAPKRLTYPLPETNGQGTTTLTIPAGSLPDTTFALKANIEVSVDDPSGRSSRGTIEVPVRPSGNLIGIKPSFAGAAVDAGTEAGFDLAAVNPDGTRIPLKAKLRLIRERPDWRLVNRGGSARYETVWKDEPLQTVDVAIPSDEPHHLAFKLDFGRYRIEVTEAGGMAATSMRFRAGWVSSDNPDVPDMVDVSADRKAYRPGEQARIHIAPPFGGEATMLVLTDRVRSVRTLSVPAGGMDVEVPVDAAWGPGAYVAVHVFRPAADAKSRPGRAIGLAWVGIDPATRKLPMAFDVADKYLPRQQATIRLRTAPGAWVSLAAVDEGILRLTRFTSPDPSDHFLGRRRLGLDIRDDWGRLIAPAEGEATVLRQGGDDDGFALPEIPQRTVTLFVPPRQAGSDGIVTFPLDLPDFNGEVRLMAVGWEGPRIGAASSPITVRDPLVAEALLPRFLAPGDEARLTVLLHNLDLPAGEAAADLSVDGPLALSGQTHLTAQLAPGARATPAATLAATGAGRGVVRLDVTGPNDFKVHREVPIWVRPSRAGASL